MHGGGWAFSTVGDLFISELFYHMYTFYFTFAQTFSLSELVTFLCSKFTCSVLIRFNSLAALLVLRKPADTHDKYARELAIALRSVVASVDYRLAPEHRHSAPLDDCFTALRYFMRNAARWHVDPARVAVAGAVYSQCPAFACKLSWVMSIGVAWIKYSRGLYPFKG